MDAKLLEALAARAEQRAQARTEIKPFEIGGQMIACKKLTSTQQLEYFGALAEAGGAADAIGVCTSLIYDSCPTLQDPELHKTLGVTDPYDTVRCLMDVREINNLGEKLYKWNGLVPDKADDKPTTEDTAKNS